MALLTCARQPGRTPLRRRQVELAQMAQDAAEGLRKAQQELQHPPLGPTRGLRLCMYAMVITECWNAILQKGSEKQNLGPSRRT